jgi:hypothetical protein
VDEAELDAEEEPVELADELTVEDADALKLELAVEAALVDAVVDHVEVWVEDGVVNSQFVKVFCS